MTINRAEDDLIEIFDVLFDTNGTAVRDWPIDPVERAWNASGGSMTSPRGCWRSHIAVLDSIMATKIDGGEYLRATVPPIVGIG
jgi:hypothetical protein